MTRICLPGDPSSLVSAACDGEGEVLRWVTATDPRAQVMEAAQERLGEDDPGQGAKPAED
jgi:hypothetical protein